MSRCVFRLVAVVLMLGVWVPAVRSAADPGRPVAVRVWPGGGITVETFWDLHLGLRIGEANRGGLPRAVDGAFGPDDTTLVIDCEANQSTPTAGPVRDGHAYSSNAVTVTRLNPAGRGDPGAWVLVRVDGARIVDLSGADARALVAVLGSGLSVPEGLTAADLLLMPTDADAVQLDVLAQHLSPRIAVLMPGSTVERVGAATVTRVAHNTVAVSAAAGGLDRDRGHPRWVQPSDQPWSMRDELARAFAQKEAANAASRAVFAPLSVGQMDFVPGNGTHTPRWNPEHMDSTERRFFSRIYHSVDPEIPVMKRRPRQQPERYTPAHPGWTGAQEARRMQRTQAYSRRFAYLLESEPTVPGTPASVRSNRLFKSPVGLLALMARHYGEHTEYVRAKMALEHWPER